MPHLFFDFFKILLVGTNAGMLGLDGAGTGRCAFELQNVEGLMNSSKLRQTSKDTGLSKLNQCFKL